MLTVGDRLPAFDLKAVTDTAIPDDDFDRVNNGSFPGKWLVLFFWPKDFTFVCPTEIIAFNELAEDFAERDAQILGASTDTDFVHLAWRQSREDLAEVGFPWLADNQKSLSGALGILDRDEGVAMRATFIIDPDGIIQFATVNGMTVGRNPKEVLRVLDALRTEELCPCGWQEGDPVIKPAA